MKPTVTGLVAGALTLSLLAGCSTAPSDKNAASATTAGGSETKSAAKTKIKVWTINRHDQDYMKAALDKFNKENKDNIEAEYQVYSENFTQSLDIALATNEGPDVFFDGSTAYTDHLPKGDLAPLDKYLTPEFKQRFGEGAFIEGINMQDGKIYSLPAVGTTPRLYYNKGIFEKAGIAGPPATLDEMVKDAKQISDKLKGQGIYGFAANLKSPSSALQRSIDFIMMRSGGVESGYDFKTGKYDFTGYKPILNAYKEIFTSNAAFPGSGSLDIDPLRTQFAAGKIGMYISWTHSEPGVYQNQFQTKENWDVAPLPTIDGVKGSQNIYLAGRWFLMNAKTKNPDQAWKVMKYLYSDEVLAGYHEKGLGLVMVPSILSKAKQPEIIQQKPSLQFDDKDKVWPPVPTNVKPEGNDMYFIMNAIIMGALDADKGLADLNQRYNAALDKAVADGKTKRVQYPDFTPDNPGKVFSK
ncbi:ABC transporter substrate-binding protein [Paenibacillus sp. TAB 01]|uniref:ABC transporter substrate-binding protein n=1 Tax=Paenibacillus sp. TAB 01 TaxID=3368988 RepID=UPI0037505B8B